MINRLIFFFLIIFISGLSYFGLTYFVIQNNRSQFISNFDKTLSLSKINSECNEKFRNQFYLCFRGDIKRLNRNLLFSNYFLAYKKYEILFEELYQGNENSFGLTEKDLSELVFDMVQESSRNLEKNLHPNKIILPIEKSSLYMFQNDIVNQLTYDFSIEKKKLFDQYNNNIKQLHSPLNFVAQYFR